MPSLNENELNDFLTGGSHIMKLATLTPEGWPYINPVWYHYDASDFLIAGRRKSQWVAHIQNDSRVSICIDTNDPPYSRVMAEATAEIVDMAWTGDWESWAVRYLGDEAGHRYYEETKHMPRVLIKITPHKVTTWAGPGWHPRYVE